MSLIVITSLLVRIAAVTVCLRLMRELGDRRFALLATMLALMAARQAGTLFTLLPEHSGLTLGGLWELPSLLVSVLGLLTASSLGDYARGARTAGAKLAQSEERYRRLFEVSPDMVCVISVTEDGLPGIILDMNDRVPQTLGYERNEMIGRSIADFDARAHEIPDRARTMQDVGTSSFETEWIAKDGSHILAEIHVSLAVLDGRPVILGVSRDVTTERAAVSRLRETNRRFIQLVENIEQGFYLYDLESQQILYSSPAWERISGVAASVVQSDPGKGLEITHPDDLPGLLEKLEAAARGETTDRYEYRIVRPDGETRWIATQNFLVPRSERAGNRVAGIITDITDARRAMDDLRESEARFRQLAENIPEASYLYDHGTATTLYATPDMADMIGVSHAEIMSDPMAWFRNVAPADRERVAAAANEAADGATFDSIEFRIQLGDGKQRWLRVRSFEIPVSEGSAKRTAGVISDITEAKHAHDALLAANRELADAHRIAGIGSGVIDLETGEVVLSQRALEMFGLDPQTTSFDRRDLDLIYDADRRASLAVLEELTRPNGKTTASFESRMKRPDGTIWWASVMCERVSTDDCSAPRVRGTFQDITERKRFEELLRSLATVTALAEEHERHRLASALHDGAVQNLGLCRVRLGQLRAEMAQHAQFGTQIDAIVDLVDATIRDTRSLLSDISPPVLTELGLVPAIEWLADEVETRSQITIHVRTAELPVALSNDLEVLMFQTVRELLANVEKHSHATSAEIRLAIDRDVLRLGVSDDGNGLPVDAPTSGPTKDGGYGLFSIRERLRLLGGTMRLSSNSNGTGTTVDIELPLATADALLAPRPREASLAS